MSALLLVLAITGYGTPTADATQQLVDAAAPAAIDTPAGAARPPAGDPDPDPLPSGSGHLPAHWIRLAECESGEWIDGGRDFVAGSARWDYGKPGGFTHEGYEQYEGGLNFHPDTWGWIAGDLGLLAEFPHAYDAPPAVQVQVAAEVQARQGWGAWPVCSVKVGLL